MKQPTLFDIRPTGHGAERIRPIARAGVKPQEDGAAMQSEAQVHEQVTAILECLRDAGHPLLAEEIAEETKILRHVVPARLHPMEHKQKLICKPLRHDGNPERRMATTGIRCFLYAITPEGRERLMT